MSLLNSAGIDFGSDSDSEDDDYVPSAEESDDHEVTSGEEGIEESGEAPKQTKRKKKTGKSESARKRKGGIKLDDEGLNDDDVDGVDNDGKTELEPKVEAKTEEKEKKHADSLWADFLKDTKPKSTPKPAATGSSSLGALVKPVTSSPSTKPEKVTVTKVYNFAGEEVTVSEQVDASSKAAASVCKSPEKSSTAVPEETTKTEESPATPKPPVTKPGGGLSGVLGKISGKPKMSVLEKTRLDWNQFKHAEGIQEELQTFNRGKDGYLERQAFLQRSDLRQFEIEKSMRSANRTKR